MTLNITPVPLADAPADVESCDSYILPALANGNYFDAPNGGGNALSAGDNITATTTIYVFSPGTGSCPDVENSFTVTINNTPLADAPADVESCDSYILPALANGNYFDAPNGGGNALSAGDNITATTTIYVFSPGTGSCPDVENSFTVTITPAPIVDAGSDEEICEGDAHDLASSATAPTEANTSSLQWSTAGDGSFDNAALLAPTYTPGANDIIAGSVVLTLTGNGNGSCAPVQDTMTLNITPAPTVDNLGDVEVCDSYILPELTDGNYFTGSGGTGASLFEGDVISTTQTIFVFNSGNGICPDAEESFEVTITGFSITTNVQNETCWESNDGSVSADIGNAVFPVTVQLNSMEPIVFNTNSFSINDLSPGNYEMSVIDDTGCQTNTNFEIQSGGPNLDASIDVMYSCDANLPSNTIVVTLLDSSISNDVLYALDSTDPNDFILSPDFGNISAGDHSLFIMHNNGCLKEIPFEIEDFEQLELILTSEYVNQITANVSGGTAPYTYYFDDNGGTTSNTYSIDRSGTFTVRVVDSNGCEVIESTTMNLVNISIPDFFTPNYDGQNDTWGPRNSELFPDIETYIFDRYGRKLKILGESDDWNGEYDSNPMPSGDYWYIVKLNDGSGREFVGHFTLYR